jgi:hypothetical protein
MSSPDLGGKVFFNGVDARTGEYLVAPCAPEAVAARVAALLAAEQRRPESLGFPFDVTDPNDLAQVGWGLVTGPGTPDAVFDALSPLLSARAAQAGNLFTKIEWTGGDASALLAQHHVAPGSIEPAKVPYYLLIVGGPETVPFDVEYGLSCEYAVGRVAFDDAASYAAYARSLVDYERASALPASRDLVLWGPRHDGDAATRLSSESLLAPLADGAPDLAPVASSTGFRSRKLAAADATRAALLDALHAASAPSVLFTASHGVGLPAGDPHQRAEQGALLCQDWTGWGSIARSHYLAAEDVDAAARVHGAVAFCFACFGAGTPELEGFSLTDPAPRRLAPAPFSAALPQRLLAHPNGGALAVLGHVDRAFACSILPDGATSIVAPFRNTLGRILRGERVGHALKDFAARSNVLGARLLQRMHDAAPADQIASLFLQRVDAQNYVCLGDPAARLRASDLK